MIKQSIQEAGKIHKIILKDKTFQKSFDKATSAVIECLSRRGKILIAGNGGSAADAQHFAAEIVGRYRRERVGYPAVALTTDTSIITAWSNDYSFRTLFSRQIEALGSRGDVFVGISTSGNSKNIISAVRQAKKQSITTVCLLGNKGGSLAGLCDISIMVPSKNTPRIQEVHIIIIHTLCEMADRLLV